MRGAAVSRPVSKMLWAALWFSACVRPSAVARCPPPATADLASVFGVVREPSAARGDEVARAPVEEEAAGEVALEACAEPSGESALDAYQRGQCLWAHALAGDEVARDAHFASYAQTLACFHGRSPTPLDRVRRERVEPWYRFHSRSHRVEVLAGDRGSALLADYGSWRRMGSPGGVYERLVQLRRVDGRWQILAETDRGHVDCLPREYRRAARAHRVPADIRRCRRRVTSCWRSCRETCRREQRMGQDGFGECGVCGEMECPCVLLHCLGEEQDLGECMYPGTE